MMGKVEVAKNGNGTGEQSVDTTAMLEEQVDKMMAEVEYWRKEAMSGRKKIKELRAKVHQVNNEFCKETLRSGLVIDELARRLATERERTAMWKRAAKVNWMAVRILRG